MQLATGQRGNPVNLLCRGDHSRLFALAVAAIVSAAPANAQLIRPDSATATSEFSSSYLITNAINGTGLPAGFGLTDAHANYAGGNHWTTQLGRTLGESATFTFNEPRELGGMYMWAHRSNNIANNPFYEITLFDLVLFDGPNGTGNELTRLTNLVGVPDLAVAQTTAFPITPNVRSVQLIVRATQNNNVSPYTGLAEVRFAPCIAAGPGSAVPAVGTCPAGEAFFDAAPAGSGPFTYQWQVADDSAPGGWANIIDGTVFVGGQRVGLFTGSQSPQLRGSGFYIGPEFPVYAAPVLLRCAVTNTCGSATTEPTTLTICPSDFNCDGERNPDDLGDYINCYFAQPPCPDADFNTDGDVNPDDLGDYINSFFAPGC